MGLHDLFLKLGCDQIHALGDGLKSSVLRAIGKLQQLVSGQHQFTYQIHETVEKVDSDADGFDSRLWIPSLHGLLCRHHVLRMSRSLCCRDFTDLAPPELLQFQGAGKILRSDVASLDQHAVDLGGVHLLLGNSAFLPSGRVASLAAASGRDALAFSEVTDCPGRLATLQHC